MMRLPRPIVSFVIAVLATSLVAACGSSPATSFYTLASVPPNPGATSPAHQAPAVIAVGPLSLPDYLDRPQLVTRTSPYTMSLSAFDQWAGPLNDMVPRVLIEDLALRLPGDRVVPFPQVSGPSFDYRIAVGINQFDIGADGGATLLASWQIYAAGAPEARLVDDDIFHHDAAGSGFGGSVAAMSTTLADFSQRLADSIAAVRTATPRPMAAQ